MLKAVNGFTFVTDSFQISHIFLSPSLTDGRVAATHQPRHSYAYRFKYRDSYERCEQK